MSVCTLETLTQMFINSSKAMHPLINMSTTALINALYIIKHVTIQHIIFLTLKKMVICKKYLISVVWLHFLGDKGNHAFLKPIP